MIEDIAENLLENGIGELQIVLPIVCVMMMSMLEAEKHNKKYSVSFLFSLSEFVSIKYSNKFAGILNCTRIL